MNCQNNVYHMYSVGVIGATGIVGSEIVRLLSARKFPISNLQLYSTERAVRNQAFVCDKRLGNITLEVFDFEAAKKHDIVFVAVSNEFSLAWCKKLSDAGVLVIDNSSQFRYDEDVPLIVPEINMQAARGCKLIANPNCTTAIALMALYPIHKEYKLKRVIVSTYQAASGAGASGLEELKNGMKQIVNDEPVVNRIFAYPLPYNIIPQIDAFMENSYTKEEMKVVWEIKKIIGDSDVKISCTAVRVPVLRSHSASITIETEKEINADDVHDLLSNCTGVDVVDDTENKMYPMPLTATNKNNIEVGRIRENLVFGHHGLDLFVSGDQILRGAALNAVIIAEQYILF